jgi:hypothetical protein
MPRVSRDIADCIQFIAKQPGGKPRDREADILAGIATICRCPRAHRIEWRRKTGVELRRHHAAQFVIIYAYIDPNDVMPGGIVSIRAVRHRRVRDPFIWA